MTQLATQQSGSVLAETVETVVDDLRSLALRALKRMFIPQQGLFAFRVRRREGQDSLEGVSPRYTAITLIGLAGEEEYAARDILGGASREEICRRLIAGVRATENVGDVALTLWAARTLFQGEEGHAALERLSEFRPWEQDCTTVELAWSLTALAIDGGWDCPDERIVQRVAERLMSSFVPASGMFLHWPAGSRPLSLRSHVSCFADLVYPIQALAHYFRRAEDSRALAVARQCAERICELQGAEGQWWWHYDARTGRIVERYPVYAVHQDAMAPMALYALQRACGESFTENIERGMRWLIKAPEIGGSLIDTSADLIWRKVARREPAKLSRRLQALVSRLHPGLRVPGLGAILPPGSVDYECRPYHLGWLLYAWPHHGLGV